MSFTSSEDNIFIIKNGSKILFYLLYQGFLSINTYRLRGYMAIIGIPNQGK